MTEIRPYLICGIRYVDDGGVSIGIHCLDWTVRLCFRLGWEVVKDRGQCAEDVPAGIKAGPLKFFTWASYIL